MATSAAWQEPRSPQVEIPATGSPYKNGSRTRSRSRDARSRSPHRRVRTPDEEAARRADGRRLYVGGLSYETTDDDLKQAFERFGTLVYCKVMTDKDTNRSRGFGFVTFTERSGADSALNYWDGNSLLGRAIRVVYARPKNDSMADKGPPAERYNDSRGFGSSRDDYKGSDYRNDAPRGGGGYPREPRGGYESRGEARPYSSAPVSTYAYPDERSGGGRARDPYPASSTRDSADYAYAQDYGRDTRRLPDPYPPRAADYRAAPKDPYRELAYSTAPSAYPSYPASTRGAYSDARSSTGAYSNGGAAYPAPRRARSRSRSPPRGAAPGSASSYNYPASNSRTSYPPVADPYSSGGGRSGGGGYGDRRASYDPAYPATSSSRGGYSGAYYEEPPRARGRSAERSRGPPPSSGAYADSRGGYTRR